MSEAEKLIKKSLEFGVSWGVTSKQHALDLAMASWLYPITIGTNTIGRDCRRNRKLEFLWN
jgi:hypothetical protein